MASITNQPNGRKTIQFIGADGKRRSIRLGQVSLAQAEAVKIKVEDLAAAALTGHAPRRETSVWLAGLDDGLRDRIAAAGLCQKRARALLGPFIDDYATGRTDVKKGTRVVFDRVRGYLVEYFGESKPIRDITPGDADAWRRNLLDRKLSDNTVRRACGIAKQFFRAAMRLRILEENPFQSLPCVVGSNPERLYFVSRDEASKVLSACPDDQWRLLFALARYGGLRVPSEALGLRWGDIDWENGCITVKSPKTERHEGHECRKVPIFPELLPYLRDSFESAAEGTEYCITRYRNTAVNLRTQLLRIIRRAGLTPWPKLWQNLRSTRETELADRFPAHVVSAWIGNSVQVAVKHYLQVTDEHFKQAVHDAVQQSRAHERNALHGSEESGPVLREFQPTAEECDPMQLQEATGDGPGGIRTHTLHCWNCGF